MRWRSGLFLILVWLLFTATCSALPIEEPLPPISADELREAASPSLFRKRIPPRRIEDWLRPGGGSPTTPPEVPPPRHRPTPTPTQEEATTPRTAPRKPAENARRARDPFRALSEEFNRKIQLSGSKRIGFHIVRISGDRNAYRDSYYFGQGGNTVTDFTELSIIGTKVFDLFNFNWRLTNTPFGTPQDRRFSINYERGGTRIDLGDITAALGGNELVSFNKTLRGVYLSTRLSSALPLRIGGVFSETRATARTSVIYGNDSGGPYYLNASQILDGSERVRVDGREMVRGKDYEIDYFTGLLTFKEGIIIPRTSTILVSFEAEGYNEPSGRLTGWRVEAPLGSLNLGVISLRQDARTSTGLRTKTERFYGYGNPLSPYELQYPVEPGSAVIATVDGVPQQQGTKRGEGDFFVDPDIPYRVYFNRAVPATSIISITYIPRLTGNATLGSRRVTGYDLNWQLGRLGSLAFYLARSQAQRGNSLITGQGKMLNARLDFGKLRWNMLWRDIDPDFVTVESVGFRRQEKGYSHSFEYTGDSRLSARLTLDRMQVPDYLGSYLSGSQRTGSASVQNTAFDATLTLPRAPQVRLSWLSQRSLSGAYGSSENQSRTLSLTHQLGRVSLSVDLLSTRASSTSTFAVGGNPTTNTYSSSSNTLRLTWSWNQSERLALNGVLARAQTRSANSSSNAQDVSVGVRWNPSRSWSINYQYSVRDSGTISNTGGFIGGNLGGSFIGPGGYQSGWGIGYGAGGNYSGGYYNPITSGLTYSSIGVKNRSHNLTVSFTPSDRLSLDLGYMQQLSAGDNLTNTDMQGLNLSANYRLSEKSSIAVSYTRQNVSYVGSRDGANTDILYFTFRSELVRNLLLNLQAQRMNSASLFSLGGSGQRQAQKMLAYSLRLEYPFAPRQSLFLEHRFSDVQGFFGSVDRDSALGYEYEINRYLAFTLSVRLQERTNRDTQYAGYNYKAFTLDADLSARF
ncbi:MAG: hypothetical protein NZ741_00715 [Armatimonadetes bacterium]|nr:hypothetical protein [Armatimonadota bacterium]